MGCPSADGVSQAHGVRCESVDEDGRPQVLDNNDKSFARGNMKSKTHIDTGGSGSCR